MTTHATGPAIPATLSRRSPADAAGPKRPLVHRIVVVDPGSTSTKVALASGGDIVASATLQSSLDYAGRLAAIRGWLTSAGIGTTEPPDAVVGRGGLLRPVPAGTYQVCDAMVADLRAGVRGDHPSNLGGLLARELADGWAVPAFVVDPVATDEFTPIARVAGIAELERVSLLHALNVRAIARLDCSARGVALADASLVVAHLGGGTSVVAVERGRLVDANNANEEGPFSPERTGGLPAGQLAGLIHAGRLPDWAAAKTFLHREGGVRAYLGTSDLREVEARISSGDGRASAVLDAMAYQLGACIGAYATVLAGRVDAVLLTGGAARCRRLVDAVTPLVDWIAPVRVYPGERELEALADGVQRVLDGTESAHDYATSTTERQP